MIKSHKAKVMKCSRTSSTIGTDVMSWSDLGSVFGVLDYISITKGEIAMKVIADSTHLFICETRMDIEQGDRLNIDGDLYEVNFVDRPMMGKHAEIQLKPILQQNDSIESFIYYGISALTDVIESDVLAMSNQAFKTKMFSKVMDITDGNLFIAYPKSFGKASIVLNSKPIIDWTINEIMVNGVLHLVYSTEVTGITLSIELF